MSWLAGCGTGGGIVLRRGALHVVGEKALATLSPVGAFEALPVIQS